MAFHPSFLPSVRTNGLFCGHPLKRKPGLACGPTDLPVLETLHFTHKFGYFSGGKTNRWHHHLFGSRQELRRQKCDHLLFILNSSNAAHYICICCHRLGSQYYCHQSKSSACICPMGECTCRLSCGRYPNIG